MDCQKVTQNIRNEFKNYMVQHHLKSVVLGISGGIDSCLVAALAKPICDEIGIKLIGRSLPIITNKLDELNRANIVGEAFCHDYKEVNLETQYDIFNNITVEVEGKLENETREKIRKGNIKARCRMIYLYNLAYTYNGLVLSTDNLTELNLGFSTIMGDWGDYAMIQYLWKTEVYKLADYLKNEYTFDKAKEALERTIQAVPTDGLGVSNSDLDQIQASSYDEVDEILQSYLYNGDKTYINHPVIQRYESSHFKRNWPIRIDRKNLFQ